MPFRGTFGVDLVDDPGEGAFQLAGGAPVPGVITAASTAWAVSVSSTSTLTAATLAWWEVIAPTRSAAVTVGSFWVRVTAWPIRRCAEDPLTPSASPTCSPIHRADGPASQPGAIKVSSEAMSASGSLWQAVANDSTRSHAPTASRRCS